MTGKIIRALFLWAVLPWALRGLRKDRRGR